MSGWTEEARQASIETHEADAKGKQAQAQRFGPGRMAHFAKKKGQRGGGGGGGSGGGGSGGGGMGGRGGGGRGGGGGGGSGEMHTHNLAKKHGLQTSHLSMLDQKEQEDQQAQQGGGRRR